MKVLEVGKFLITYLSESVSHKVTLCIVTQIDYNLSIFSSRCWYVNKVSFEVFNNESRFYFNLILKC